MDIESIALEQSVSKESTSLYKQAEKESIIYEGFKPKREIEFQGGTGKKYWM